MNNINDTQAMSTMNQKCDLHTKKDGTKVIYYTKVIRLDDPIYIDTLLTAYENKMIEIRQHDTESELLQICSDLEATGLLYPDMGAWHPTFYLSKMGMEFVKQNLINESQV